MTGTDEKRESEPPSPLSTAGAALEELAVGSPSPVGAALLQRIGREAQNGGRGLAGVDLITTYPPEVLVPDRPFYRGRAAARLATLRDVAVFVPIVVTWYSLYLAFDEFEDAKEGANFLQVWSHGFGGTAILVVTLLVALVVVITLVLHRLDGAHEREASRSGLRQQVAEQLLLINAEVSLTVADDAAKLPSGKLRRLANEITAATGDLAETMRSGTDRLARIFEPGPESGFTQALERWSNSADELGAMGRSLKLPHDVLYEFKAMRDRLSAEERATRGALQSLVAELGEATETSRVSDRAHSRVAEVVVEGSRQVALAMDKFIASSESLYGYMTVLQRVLDRLDSGWTSAPPSGMAMSNADLYAQPGPGDERPYGLDDVGPVGPGNGRFTGADAGSGAGGNGRDDGTNGSERSEQPERAAGRSGTVEWYEPEGE